MKCKLRALLQEMGISVYAFCKKTGFNESTFRHWVAGRTFPNPYNIDVLCTVLKVSISDLFEHEPVEIPYMPVLKHERDKAEYVRETRMENLRLKARLRHVNKKELAKLPESMKAPRYDR